MTDQTDHVSTLPPEASAPSIPLPPAGQLASPINSDLAALSRTVMLAGRHPWMALALLLLFGAGSQAGAAWWNRGDAAAESREAALEALKPLAEQVTALQGKVEPLTRQVAEMQNAVGKILERHEDRLSAVEKALDKIELYHDARSRYDESWGLWQHRVNARLEDVEARLRRSPAH